MITEAQITLWLLWALLLTTITFAGLVVTMIRSSIGEIKREVVEMRRDIGKLAVGSARLEYLETQAIALQQRFDLHTARPTH